MRSPTLTSRSPSLSFSSSMSMAASLLPPTSTSADSSPIATTTPSMICPFVTRFARSEASNIVAKSSSGSLNQVLLMIVYHRHGGYGGTVSQEKRRNGGRTEGPPLVATYAVSGPPAYGRRPDRESSKDHKPRQSEACDLLISHDPSRAQRGSTRGTARMSRYSLRLTSVSPFLLLIRFLRNLRCLPSMRVGVEAMLSSAP